MRLVHQGAIAMSQIALDRRRFFQATAMMLGASALRAEVSRKTPVVDAHLHCFAGKDDKRFP
jgi:hypothetical protein